MENKARTKYGRDEIDEQYSRPSVGDIDRGDTMEERQAVETHTIFSVTGRIDRQGSISRKTFFVAENKARTSNDMTTCVSGTADRVSVI